MKILPLDHKFFKYACEEQMSLIRKEWPEGIPLESSIIDKVLKLKLDLNYLINQLPEPTLKEYLRIQEPAWKEYKRIREPAWKEYLRIIELAWEEYLKIREPAWKEYERKQARALLTILISLE